MKTTNKWMVLFCMGLAVVGCSDDELVKETPQFVPGEEIRFGASAETESAKSRTVYGDLNDAGTKIEVNWVTGDKLQIASPQTGGNTIAEYQVTGIAGSNGYVENHAAATLEKIGEVGLQWSTETTYDFYAMYPSYSSFTEQELAEVELTTTGTMTGYLPTLQNPKAEDIPETPTNGGYTIDPDMRYAFMVAKHEDYSTVKDDGYGNTVANDEMINLNFKSLVTALQFEITANTIGTQTDGSTDLTLKSVSLLCPSENNIDICGAFQYTYSSDACENANTATGFNNVTMTLGENGVTLTKDQFCDVTFFLLPVDIPAGKLKLQVIFEVGGTTQTRTATIKTDIKARKKYRFNDVLLPEIKADVTGSSWFSALDPNTYISQLSIPVAGNAFTNSYTGTNPQYFKEQVQSYTTLWNMGVRGFEFKVAIGHENGTFTNTLEDEKFVCNGNSMEESPTFGEAFRELESMFDKDLSYANECLIVIITYQPYSGDGGFNPQRFVNDLEHFIDDSRNVKIKNRLVKLSPNSTVGDLQGKIAIIVRPGDDEYIEHMNDNGHDIAIPITTTKTDITLVKNWGTSVDCWDRRFGTEGQYARQKVFGQEGDYVENYLYGVSTSSTDFSEGQAFQTGYPTDDSDNYKFEFETNESGQTMHIQEFARVSPVDTDINVPFYGNVYASYDNDDRYLWLKWPESYSQKKNMIDATLTASMATKGGTASNKLFINSLCGYYILLPEKHPQSCLPYAGGYSYNENNNASTRTYNFSTDNAGMGGDQAGLAGDLNKYFYDKIKAAEGTEGQGPLGLVMMNYIGSSESDFSTSDYIGTDGHATAAQAASASTNLLNTIIMYNFTFPLATRPVVSTEGGGSSDSETSETVSYNATYSNGSNAISFE